MTGPNCYEQRNRGSAQHWKEFPYRSSLVNTARISLKMTHLRLPNNDKEPKSDSEIDRGSVVKLKAFDIMVEKKRKTALFYGENRSPKQDRICELPLGLITKIVQLLHCNRANKLQI